MKEQEGAKELRIKVATEAYEHNCLIRHYETGQWYTPREFVETRINVIIRHYDGSKQTYENVGLFYASALLKQKSDELKKLQAEHNVLLEKIFSIYDLKPMSKKKRKVQY